MRIGIVNDTQIAREAIRRVVSTNPEYHVAWTASNGAEAIQQARRDTPDVILMDLIMPGTNGAEATRRIMSETPCPIVVVTASVTNHVSMVYEAMGHGAIDAVDTPTFGPFGEMAGAQALLSKIATVGKLSGKSVPPCLPFAPAAHTPPRSSGGEVLVAIGASTGGPNAIAQVLSSFPFDWKATVVLIQHIDPIFAPGLARWLSERSGHQVDVAKNGHQPEPGQIFLASTGDHLVLDPGPKFRYVNEPRDLCFRPSADVFFASAAAHWPSRGVAVLLTGMLSDGASGLLTLRRSGWHTIAQDEGTSVVWGMPRAAVEIGAAENVLSISRIGPAIVDHVANLSRVPEDVP